ncbi:MAG: M6 family metalloprotease domain-containing protein [Fibrobacteria bacterium]|nr:M6 family metalloprotease domain-containing protein [Fibrobacteria bacterium]
MKKVKILFVCFFMLFSAPQARPYDGELFNLRQPDHSLVPVKCFGDEYYMDMESPEGFTLTKDLASGYLCYARLAADENSYTSSGVTYRQNLAVDDIDGILTGLRKGLRISTSAVVALQEDKRSQIGGVNPSPKQTAGFVPLLSKRAVGGIDTVVGLTLLVDFPDKKSDVSRATLDELFNKTGFGNYGSVKDYYEDASGGKFVYINTLTQFVTMKNNKPYYDTPNQTGRVSEIISEGLQKAKDAGFDFSHVSSSGSRFLALNVLYAGKPEAAWPYGLWAHQGTYSGSFAANGVRPYSYQITEIGSSTPNIGTICHENGHMLFDWADLYSYTNSFIGVGTYSLMGKNFLPNPQMVNPYYRYTQGWMEVTDLSAMESGSLLTVIANSNQCFSWYNATAGPYEVFLIEALPQSFRNSDLPDGGLAIWHVHTRGSNTDGRQPFLVALEQADGKGELETGANSGNGGDLFHGEYNDSFNDNTTPSAKFHSGAASGLHINHIGPVGEYMTFRLGENGTSFVRLVKPYPGDTFEQGDVCIIQWITNLDEAICIELYNNGKFARLLDSSFSGEGTYVWNIPNNLPGGKNYSIRLRGTDNKGVVDSSSTTFTINPQTLISKFPYTQTFDNFPSGEILQNGWKQSVRDSIDWMVFEGITPIKAYYGDSGPDGDHTSGDGKYMYLKASKRYAKQADLLSPWFNLKGMENLELSFWVHMFSKKGNMGELFLDIATDGKWKDSVLKLEGDHGDEWFEQKVDLSAYAGAMTQFRFRAITGSNYDSEICIDDFSIKGDIVRTASALKKDLFIQKKGNLLYMSHEHAVQVYGLDGDMLLRREPGNTIPLDIGFLPEGLYFITSGEQQFRLVKHN